MSAKLLSSLVQTRSIELVMAPIASQVSQLIILNEAGEKEGIPMPMLVSHATKICTAITNLIGAAQTLVKDSSNETFKQEMPEACVLVTAAGKNLLDATKNLGKQPFSHDIRYALVDSARNILETTMKVLLVYDKAEVKKIVCAACWVIDKLGLTEAVTSMDGFLVSFKGLSESLVLLVSLCDKRQRELLNSDQRSRLLSAIAILRQAVSALSATMQVFFKNPAVPSSKVNKDYVIGQIKFACNEIIKIVENRDDETTMAATETPSMSATMKKAYNQLNPGVAMDTSNQLDCYLDAIVRSSMAVADMSHDDSRDSIVEACQNILETRNDLIALQNTLSKNADSLTRETIDKTTKTLSDGLQDLDRHVTLAITEQIHDVFSDIHSPARHLLDAATTSYDNKDQEYALMVMRQAADQFQLHGSKTVEIAKHATSIASDTEKIHIIRETSAELDRLLPVFISTAFTVKQNPHDQATVNQLGSLSCDWANKVELLVDALDDVISMEDLLKITGNSFFVDVCELQEALSQSNTARIAETSQSLASKGERFIQITKKAVARTDDPFNSEILTVMDGVQSGIPSLVEAVHNVLSNTADHFSRDAAQSLVDEISNKVKAIQNKMTGTTPTTRKVNGAKTTPNKATTTDKRNCKEDTKIKTETLTYGNSRTKTSIDMEDDSLSLTSSDISSLDELLTPIILNDESPRYQQPKRFSPPSPPSMSTIEPRANHVLMDKDDGRITWTDKKALIGVGDLSHLFSQPAQLSRTSRAPVVSLIQTAKNGDRTTIEKHINNTISQATRLIGLAEKCLETSPHVEQARHIQVTSGEIENLTPIIKQAARDVTANPRDKRSVERLNVIGREWASKTYVLGNAIDTIVTPWSAVASKLALAAANEDTTELKKQINNINDEAVRLRQLALSAIAAADAEDYAMDPGNETDDFERNPDSCQRIKLLKATSHETNQVIPELILAAQSLIVNPNDMSRLDHLEFLRRVWACNVNDLIAAVDDVIVGTSAPVEQLTNAAMRSDSLALHDTIRSVVSYTRTLKDMATAATTGCSNPKKAVLVESTIASIERVTADLQETSHAVAELSTITHKSLQQQLAFMSIEEKMNLLGREWSTKVHLLTALVDDLTAHVSAPVDRLAGAALAVAKAEIVKKPTVEREFEVQARELSSRVARVRSQASKAVEKSSHPGQVRTVRVTCDFIDRLTPQVIGSASALADNPDQPTVEHFQLLRRQWSSKAHMLIATLRELHDANSNAVKSVIDDLLASGTTIQPAVSSESFTDLLSSSHVDPKLFDSLPMSTSSSLSSPKQANKKTPPRTKPRPTRPKTDSRAMSDSEETTLKPRVPIGASSSETDLRSLLVAELHDRFSSNESLKRSGWDARYWAKFEVNTKKHQRAASMANLSRTSSDWLSESTEDLRNRKSAKSLEISARALEDEVDQWEEENNSIVQVAKTMTQQMMEMAQIAKQRGKHQNQVEMTNTAKAIAANSKIIQNFAHVIADACADDRSREDLLYYAECLPTMSTQLSILSSVKAAAPTDPSADAMLVRNADNLMQAVVKTLRAAEAASVKEFVKQQTISGDSTEATQLAFNWKKKLKRQRRNEMFTTTRDHLGLRKRDHKPSPSLADIVHV